MREVRSATSWCCVPQAHESKKYFLVMPTLCALRLAGVHDVMNLALAHFRLGPPRTHSVVQGHRHISEFRTPKLNGPQSYSRSIPQSGGLDGRSYDCE